MERQVAELKGEEKPSPETLFELKSMADAVDQLTGKLAEMLSQDNPNSVRWLEAGMHAHGSWCSLYSAPVSVGIEMAKGFWPQVDSVILSSATLTTAGSFSHLKESLGLHEIERSRIVENIFDSPFDLARQMRIYVPTFPDQVRVKNRVAHELSVTDMVTRIVKDVSRGTLILCTSLDFVEKLSNALDPVVKGTQRALFSQTRGKSPNDLIESFRSHKNAILIGSSSFWEGIDVVGEALQILIVAKLPFDVPTEPWVEARSEALQSEGHDAFSEFSLPVTTLRLKQGIGRLIRHQTDHGVAILADPRLLKTSFGRSIRDSLPGHFDSSSNM